jgi:hypothetical protein
MKRFDLVGLLAIAFTQSLGGRGFVLGVRPAAARRRGLPPNPNWKSDKVKDLDQN